ncbi:ABC transporter substrate-binding protein [Fodinicola acaciae]|uniref:ABC transporter substrate-binding protein n=1 Tax=Fodinicola acaciae TaxID=2681555 RepID=UPI0013D89C15|nr:sugar ABC transporter substrate-binding protein [Fodinicola acaciae]
MRPYSRRDVLRAGGALTLAGMLAACGSNTGRSGGSAVSQWYHQYGEKGTQQAAEKFARAYTKATVNVTWTPGDYDQKLATGLLSSNGPDVFEGGVTVDKIRANQIVPLDDIFDAVKSDFTAAAIEENIFEGKMYAIPMILDMQVLFYRKSLLQKAGVQPPKTIPELVEAAAKLTTKQVKGLFLGNFSRTNANTVVSPLSIWASGGDLITKDHKAGFNTPGVAQTLTALRQLFTSGHLLLGAPTDWSDPSAFNQGLTAMQWSGIWAIPAVKQTFGDDFGVLPWPSQAAGGTPSVPIGTWGAMVNAKSKNLEAAKAYVKWLWIDQKQYQEEWATSYGFHIPVRNSILDKAAAMKTPIGADVANFSKQYAKTSSPAAWTPKMDTAYGDLITNVIQNGANPAAELAKAEKAVNTELKTLFP